MLLPLAVLLASSPLLAQRTLAPAAADVARPTAIAGMASSARHCVSADGANVHEIGWMAVGTAYTITFDADFTLVASVNRLDLAAGTSTTTFGTATGFRNTASTPGTMTLNVGAGSHTRTRASCAQHHGDMDGVRRWKSRDRPDGDVAQLHHDWDRSRHPGVLWRLDQRQQREPDDGASRHGSADRHHGPERHVARREQQFGDERTVCLIGQLHIQRPRHSVSRGARRRRCGLDDEVAACQ